MGKYIIVNATALDRSGALSILRQFVENIPWDNRRWLVFVSPSVSITTDNPNVRIKPIEGVKPMHLRLLWDAFGLKKWLKHNDIDPIAAISLQNTGFNVGKEVPSYIYYHQSIPFFSFKWNPLKKQERIFWFYKNIYPLFVRLFLKKDTQVFVQLAFIKEGFTRRFGHNPDLVKVYSPSVVKPQEGTSVRNRLSDSLELIYPAMPHFYKNHRVIKESLKLMDVRVKIFFTFDASVKTYRDPRIKLIGMQPYDRLCELYQTSDALLFPSYIETYGLPLLEAAMTGLPIIASDLPYAREVLKGYEGVIFVKYDDPKAWAAAIKGLGKGKRYKPFSIAGRPGWKGLFSSIKA